MIAEHELIEQIEEDDLGRPIGWVCDLLVALGKDKPFEVLRGMWRGKYIQLVDSDGSRLPAWRCEELLRLDDKTAAVNVVSTDLGSDWVHNG